MTEELPRHKEEKALPILWFAAMALLIFFLNLPISPIYQALEADSGVYAYIGSAILDGQLPYRDVWEHKPPIGLYLNALALGLFGHTPWAIWWFNILWILFTSTFFFLIIRKMFGFWAGIISSTLFIAATLQPALFQGGNLMEVYGMLPQVLLIGSVFLFFASNHNKWILATGFLMGIAFMTKQTSIALGISSAIAIGIVTLLRKDVKALFFRAGIFATGFITPVLLFASFWLVQGAINDFLDAILLHSFSYVGARVSFLWSLKHTTLTILPGLFISWLYYIAFGVFVLYLLQNYRWLTDSKEQKSTEIPPVELAMLAVFIAMPFEIAFASLGARNFGHYFLSLIPAGATVSAYISCKSIAAIKASFEKKRLDSFLTPIWVILLLASGIWTGIILVKEIPNLEQAATLPSVFSGKFEPGEMEKYVIETTNPEDKVLVWHIHIGINFVTNRRTSARVLFPMNLFIIDRQGNSKLDGFIAELEASPPELIIIQKPSSTGLPFVDEPLDSLCAKSCIPEMASGLQEPVIYAGMVRLQAFFQKNYVLDKQFYDWVIYRYIH